MFYVRHSAIRFASQDQTLLSACYVTFNYVWCRLRVSRLLEFGTNSVRMVGSIEGTDEVMTSPADKLELSSPSVKVIVNLLIMVKDH